MELRLGQPVKSTDGPFGEVGGVVVDPQLDTVTHLVVEPHGRHLQARLVPTWLVTVEGDEVRVNLDDSHLRHLQRVSYSDFLPLDDEASIGTGWDIGTVEAVSLPYWTESELGFEIGLDRFESIEWSYDRIPKGECEIRRWSEVVSSDGRRLGTVEGFVADGDHLTAVVVRSGRPGRRHNVAVPIGAVTAVASDEIHLDHDQEQFAALPRATGLEGPLGDHSAWASVEQWARRLASDVRRWARPRGG